jgi:hypothetical protein
MKFYIHFCCALVLTLNAAILYKYTFDEYLINEVIPHNRLQNYQIYGVDRANVTDRICDGTSDISCFYNISEYLISKNFP